MNGTYPSSPNGNLDRTRRHLDGRPSPIVPKADRLEWAKPLELLTQAVRHPSSEGEGRTFESCRVRQPFQAVSRRSAVLNAAKKAPRRQSHLQFCRHGDRHGRCNGAEDRGRGARPNIPWRG